MTPDTNAIIAEADKVGTSDAASTKIEKALEGLLKSHGSSNEALKVLLNENFTHREHIRELKAKLPAEGSVVLDDEDVKRWKTYSELGTPQEIRTAIDERKRFQSEASDLLKEKVIVEAAEITGIKPGPLLKLAKDLNIKLDVIQKDGKAVKVAYVMDADGKGKLLLDYVTEKLPDFLPALIPKQENLGSPRAGFGAPKPEINQPPRRVQSCL